MRGAADADSRPGRVLAWQGLPRRGMLDPRRVIPWLRRLLAPPAELPALGSGVLALLRLYHPELAAHSARTARQVRALAGRLGFPPAEAARLEAAALCHDLGKVFVPREVLYAPRLLGARERALVESHPGRGAGVLLAAGRPLPEGLLDTVAHHHERWDGSGYPCRLAGTGIPFAARLVAVADSLDAMTHPRPYRPTLALGEALAELLAGAGSQLDPGLVLAVLAHHLDVPFSGSAA